MLEQEMASIIKFILDRAENPSPYYWNVPEHFLVPAVYFPTPEIDTGGETFLTYYVDYAWYILFFHKTAQEAYSLGYEVANAIRRERNLIPIIGEDGNEIAREWVRISDPTLAVLDGGAAQLTIKWRSRKPYNTIDGIPVMRFNFDVFMKSGKIISDAEAAEIEQYAAQSNQPAKPEKEESDGDIKEE